jgi:hypothetical protein
MRRLLKDDEYVPEMPPLQAEYEHVLAYLFEVGPTLYNGGMGEGPLTHSELVAWQWNTGIELSSWEARALLQLSRAYLVQSGLAEKPDCKPPWLPEGLEFRRAVALDIRNSIRGMISL